MTRSSTETPVKSGPFALTDSLLAGPREIILWKLKLRFQTASLYGSINIRTPIIAFSLPGLRGKRAILALLSTTLIRKKVCHSGIEKWSKRYNACSILAAGEGFELSRRVKML